MDTVVRRRGYAGQGAGKQANSLGPEAPMAKKRGRGLVAGRADGKEVEEGGSEEAVKEQQLQGQAARTAAVHVSTHIMMAHTSPAISVSCDAHAPNGENTR